MLLSIILIPLLNFIILSLFGRFLGRKGASFLLPVTMCFCTLNSYLAFYQVAYSGFVYVILGC
jgi:NADH:ubiquinone oxidoreductase subunit 5 (subunit L)/multisubunit Na+/H+ antiporter MnhA subunit